MSNKIKHGNSKKTITFLALLVFLLWPFKFALAVCELDQNFGTNGISVYSEGLGYDMGMDLIAGSNGNVYATGLLINNFGDFDIALFKYNSLGNLATGYPKIYDGGYGNDYAYKIVLDSEGNVLIAGGILNSSGNSDAALLKYDSSGDLVSGYPKTYDSGHGDDVFQGIVLDNEGNTLAFGSVKNASSNFDVALFKYDSSGDLVSGYPKTYDSGHGNDFGRKITIDENGNTYSTASVMNASNEDMGLFKYDSSGDLVSGYPKTYDSGHGNDFGMGIILDSEGNILIAGSASNASGNEDGAFFKYSSSGSLVGGYPKLYDGGNGDDESLSSLARNSLGNIFLVGTAYDGLEAYVYLTAYDSSGDIIEDYPKVYENNYYDEARGLSVDVAGNIYLAGDTDDGLGNSYLTIFKYITSPSTPSASTPGGSYSSSQTVSLSSTSDATIRYTLDGTTPIVSSSLYSSPINISQSLTLKAKAFKSQLSSGVMTENYVIATGGNGDNSNENTNDNPENSDETAPNNQNVNNANTNNNFSPDPILAIGNRKIYNIDGNTVTIVSKPGVVFRGKIPELARGRVELYKDNRKLKRVKISRKGKWRIPTRLKKKVTNSYHLKYFNSLGQETGTTPVYQIRAK